MPDRGSRLAAKLPARGLCTLLAGVSSGRVAGKMPRLRLWVALARSRLYSGRVVAKFCVAICGSVADA